MPPRKRRKTDQPSNKLSEKKTKSGSKAAPAAKSSTDVKRRERVVINRWIMKSEPESRFEKGVDVKFGLKDLKLEPDQTACWDGVRNYQARNILRDQMKVGHLAFFYHSNIKVPGIAGIVEITKEGYVDYTQFDKKDPHYDGSSTRDNPRWFMVDVTFVRDTKRFISLAELKEHYQKHLKNGGPLKNLALFKGVRLSVQPVTEEEFDFILGLEDKPIP